MLQENIPQSEYLVQSVRPPETSADELERIMQEQQVEQTWWSTYSDMSHEQDIDNALESGRAVKVSREGVGYKISERVPEKFHVLDASAHACLEDVAIRWKTKLASMNLDAEDLFLVVSSLARTTEYQQELIAQGYPAAETSTHTKLGAFDIGIAWFEQNRPDLLEVLRMVIDELSEEQEINAIYEPEVGALHIAVKPDYVYH